MTIGRFAASPIYACTYLPTHVRTHRSGVMLLLTVHVVRHLTCPEFHSTTLEFPRSSSLQYDREGKVQG